MALVSVQTKLTTMLALAQELRNSCLYYANRLGDGTNVQTQELVNIARHLREIVTRAAPFVGDTAVSAEADRQFAGQVGWQEGAILALLASVPQAIEQTISVAVASVPSVTVDGRSIPVLSSWAADGTISPFEVVPAAVQNLRTALRGLAAAIPE